MGSSMARACANIALVKYWGKRDRNLNLPAGGSVSITLSSLQTTTRVTFDDGLRRDEMVLDGEPAAEGVRSRTGRFLDLVRTAAGTHRFALVESHNSFPTASGLASSASGFAALALAACRAAGMDPGWDGLAQLARRGSGSAPRSLLGGFVELMPGESPDGSDCLVRQVADPDYWDLRLLVVINGQSEKEVGSTEGMELTRLTSPFYGEWLRSGSADVDAALNAIVRRDFRSLGQVAETSCFRMHAVALSASPPLLYWNAVTVDAIHKVRALRKKGLGGYVTIDAGPHVKVLCRASDSEDLAREIREVPGVERVVIERPGPGAEVIE